MVKKNCKVECHQKILFSIFASLIFEKELENFFAVIDKQGHLARCGKVSSISKYC